MLDEYPFAEIEPRWQARWAEVGLFKARGAGEPYYCLMMYPYPSGKLHMGHIINYSIGDSLVRYHLMRGRDVLTPMGWDSFGLPAENRAIQTGTPPAVSTRECIHAMRKQMVRAGFGYDWSRELATSHPGYYRWTQWLFLQLFKNGLAVRKKAPVNWCSSCQTVLANEQVHDGACERCGTTVEPKDLEQWFFRMSAYAQRLLDGHRELEGKWPDRVIKMQREWIGRSEGARLDFEVVAPGSPAHGRKIQVFTTRPDTAYGVTFFSLAPEHPLIEDLVRGTDRESAVLDACRRMRAQDAILRASEEGEKEGIWTGRHVRNPFDGSLAELWAANYVLMEYGTGAVMAVPAHDQRDFLFARRYGLPVKVVIRAESAPGGGGGALDGAALSAAHEGEGVQVNSGPFDGLASRAEAIRRMTEHAREKGFGDFTVNYRLKDWLLSRQRYWGAPIPVIYCGRCGIVPVPEDQLPVLLPENVEFRPTGESPLALCEGFVRASCPSCGGPARRETDTMDTFVDSSWYFLRYVTPRDDERPFDPVKAGRWLPVHQYVGGIEHATMHLIYARFFTRVLHDLGLIPFAEPFERLFCQGMVCKTAYRCEEHKWLAEEEVDVERLACKRCGRKVATEMAKMSKTKKNGVSPDALFERYGADTVHCAILFLGPADQDLEFDERGVQGVHRFLRRLWDTVIEVGRAVAAAGGADRAGSGGAGPGGAGAKGAAGTNNGAGDGLSAPWQAARRKCHEILKRVTDAFETRAFGFNTSISGIMEVVNALREAGLPGTDAEKRAAREVLDLTVQMVSPFAPHLAEELWGRLEHADATIFRVPWPAVDPGALVAEEVEVAVQVNGKVRGHLRLPPGSSQDLALGRARELQAVASQIAGKDLRRVVWVKDKLLNLVV
jgi:leucyl-tRNA synthetase